VLVGLFFLFVSCCLQNGFLCTIFRYVCVVAICIVGVLCYNLCVFSLGFDLLFFLVLGMTGRECDGCVTLHQT
jgi:hypothetical protein